ncbi:MAG: DUF167 domain-containing protein [Gemmataceae bacterium]|nr:DUF167 domain-containing protein [Gemmataceae bacterium]
MIPLQPHADGWILCVRAAPAARQNQIRGLHGSALKISVTAPPEDGKANDALLCFLAQKLGIAQSQLTLLSGNTRRDKKILITGLDRPKIEQRLGGQA